MARAVRATRATQPANQPTLAELANVAALAGSRGESAALARLAIRTLESHVPTRVLRPARPTSQEGQAKLAEEQADLMATVIRNVLDGLGLTDAQFERGIELAIAELQSASDEGWWPL
jgi:hypothetical protein